MKLLYLISVMWVMYAQEWAAPCDMGGKCKSEMDSVTKQRIYLTGDTEPVNEGGQSALMRAFNKKVRLTDTIEEVPPVTVAFIVDKDGSIKGERVLRDKTQIVGRQLLEVIRSLKWTPGKCNGRTVPMLVKQNMVIEIGRE
ncbi:MAG TPA: hypothetical protein VEB42_04125 [Chitinophagaceae bacterium]|nr:hypothetical protein [Chitinophagaceae bacterium]